jgi:hypothetical protein
VHETYKDDGTKKREYFVIEEEKEMPEELKSTEGSSYFGGAQGSMGDSRSSSTFPTSSKNVPKSDSDLDPNSKEELTKMIGNDKSTEIFFKVVDYSVQYWYVLFILISLIIGYYIFA